MRYTSLMKTSDADIKKLGKLVTSSSLAALTEDLDGRVLKGEDLLILGSEQDCGALPGHILLHDSKILSPATKKVQKNRQDSLTVAYNNWRALWGSEFWHSPDVGAQHAAITSQRNIAARVVLAVRLLSESVFAAAHPGEHQLVQRDLSTALLENPVLLHPNILIPVLRREGIEYIGVLHALALVGAGLPRASHFPDSAQLLRSRLANFAKHPCVELAMRVPDRVRVALTPELTGSSISRTRLVPHAFSNNIPKVQFLASVMELDDLRDAYSQEGGVGDPKPALWQTLDGVHGTTLDGDTSLRDIDTNRVLHAMALATLCAGGIINVPGDGNEKNNDNDKDNAAGAALHYPKDPGFLAAMAHRSKSLAKTDFQSHIESSLARRVFEAAIARRVSPGNPLAAAPTSPASAPAPAFTAVLGARDVRVNTELLIDVLLESGVVPVNHASEAEIANNRKASATFILESVLGSRRRKVLSATSAAHSPALAATRFDGAIEFLRVMEDVGALGGLQETRVMNGIIDEVARIQDEGVVAYRSNAVWHQVVNAFGNERIMRAALARSQETARNAASNAAGNVVGAAGNVASTESTVMPLIPTPASTSARGHGVEITGIIEITRNAWNADAGCAESVPGPESGLRRRRVGV